MSINFKNPDLPALLELMGRPQWVAWRYKDVTAADGTKKKTKPPVNPKIGGGASHSDPATWGTYAQARVFAMSRKMAGVGFVLTDDDGFTGVDLDKCRNPETGELEPWAAEIVALAETYTEVSPSGAGLRLIVRGKVEATVKCDPAHVEIYKSQRYLTVTGNHVEGTPTSIEPAPKTLAALLARVEAHQPKAEPIAPQAEPAKPERAGLNFFGGKEREPRARKPPAAKGDFWKNLRDATMNDVTWFRDLFPAATFQPGTGGWRVKSKYLGRNLEEDISITPGAANGGIVDFGVHDMGDKRLGKRTAVDLVMEWGVAATPEAAARWLCDRVNLTMESLGWTERAGPPPEEPATKIEVQPDGTVIDAETGEVLVQPEEEAKPLVLNDGVGEDLPERLTKMPGILGDLVDFIFDTSSNPSRTVALVTALAITGTVAGRYWGSPTNSGTHFYWAILGKSGIGKQHVIDMGKIVLGAVGGRDLIGPDDFTSQGAIFSHIKESPLSLCFFDELGDTLGRVMGKNKRASTHESGIASVLKKLWGVNFGEIGTQAYVQRRAETVFAPAMSIIGVSTPDQFWGALEGGDIKGGFLNRFLVFPIFSERKTIIPKIDGNAKREVPSQIIRWLQTVHCGGNKIIAESNARRNKEPILPQTIPWASDGAARDLYLQYASTAVSRFEGTDREHLADFYARAAENANRLATLYALAENARAPRVSAEGMRWAIDVVEWSAECAIRSADLYMSETEYQANAQAIKRALVASPGKMMSRSELIVRLNHKIRRRELDDLIALMVEGKQIETMEEKKKGGKPGKPATFYRYVERAAPAPIPGAAT